MIPINQEPADMYENTHVYEKCIFCNNPTDMWHEQTNKPVCEECDKVRNVKEIPLKISKIITTMGNKTITPEVKAKVMALYWGGKCFTSEMGSKIWTMGVDTHSLGWFAEFGYLKLKDLSEISDEDAIEVLFVEKPNGFEHIKTWRYDNSLVIDYRWIDDNIKLEECFAYIGKDGFAYSTSEGLPFNDKSLTPFQIDKLRELGYAVSYLNYSVADLISAKVFQLTTNKNTTKQ
jgi:hypothetical protein